MSDMQKKLALVSILLLILALPARYLILSRAKPVSLKEDPLAYQIEKSLQTSDSSYRPLEGKDYTITAKKFFEDNTWVAVSIEPVSGNLNGESLVLKKMGQDYKVVYGPSNFFQEASFNSLPTNIKSYLINQ